jgi:hypothetical protein
MSAASKASMRRFVRCDKFAAPASAGGLGPADRSTHGMGALLEGPKEIRVHLEETTNV